MAYWLLFFNYHDGAKVFTFCRHYITWTFDSKKGLQCLKLPHDIQCNKLKASEGNWNPYFYAIYMIVELQQGKNKRCSKKGRYVTTEMS